MGFFSNISLKLSSGKQLLFTYENDDTKVLDVNVPGDGNCMFYAVTLAFLQPVIANSNREELQRRCAALFGEEYRYTCNTLQTADALYRALFSDDDESQLKDLIRYTLRGRVVEYIRLHANNTCGFVIDDHLQSSQLVDVQSAFHTSYVLIGDRFFYVNKRAREWVEIHLNEGNASMLRGLLQEANDSHRLLNDEEFATIQAVTQHARDNIELNEVLIETDHLTIEHYLNAMRQSGTWGGNLELTALGRMLRAKVIVFKDATAGDISKPSGFCDETLFSGQGLPDVMLPDIIINHVGDCHYHAIIAERPVELVGAGIEPMIDSSKPLFVAGGIAVTIVLLSVGIASLLLLAGFPPVGIAVIAAISLIIGIGVAMAYYGVASQKVIEPSATTVTSSTAVTMREVGRDLQPAIKKRHEISSQKLVERSAEREQSRGLFQRIFKKPPEEETMQVKSQQSIKKS